jgi:hypothetical protein
MNHIKYITFSCIARSEEWVKLQSGEGDDSRPRQKNVANAGNGFGSALA